MADVHRLTTSEDAEREASEWIARLNADDVSEEDRAQFEAWRRTHPRHSRAYEELSATWRSLKDAGELVRAVSLGQALGASTQQALRQSVAVGSSECSAPLHEEPSQYPRSVRKRHGVVTRMSLAVAATVAAIAIGTAWVLWQQPPQTLFQTAIGERASVELPDGSSLELNSNSLARVDYDEGARVIRLERGEAFFEVQRDAHRPFWVVAGDSWVRAVGTAFNVYIRPTGVRVTVSEGTVKVAAAAPAGSNMPSDQQLADGAISVLTAGQQVDVSRGATEVRSLEPTALTRSVAWRSGTLYFENARLGEVADELMRYTTLEIVIEDDSLRELPVGGTFESNPQGAEALLTMLHDGFGLRIRRAERRVHVTAPE